MGLFDRLRYGISVALVTLAPATVAFWVVVIAFLLTAAAVALVIPLEERELAERFGDEYEAYRRRVPALIPRRGVARR